VGQPTVRTCVRACVPVGEFRERRRARSRRLRQPKGAAPGAKRISARRRVKMCLHLELGAAETTPGRGGDYSGASGKRRWRARGGGEKAVEGQRLTAGAAECSMEPEEVGAERIDDEVSGGVRRCRGRGAPVVEGTPARGATRGRPDPRQGLRDPSLSGDERLGVIWTRRTRRRRPWQELQRGGVARTVGQRR
jgi:hypothetical protein